MKQVLLILTVVTLISCQKQRDTYLIRGNVKEIPDSTIIDLYIQYDRIEKRISSDTIINGQFEFSDTLKSRPTKMNLVVRDRKSFFGNCHFWVDYEVIEITGSGKYLSAWIPSGNNKELIALNKLKSKTKHLDIKLDSLLDRYLNNMNNKEIVDSVLSAVNKTRLEKYTIGFTAIEENPNSLSAVEYFYEIVKYDSIISKNRIMNVYESLDSVYKNTLYGEGILSFLEEKDIPEIGDVMIDFIAYNTNGEKHNLSEFKGKYILLDFWAVGCGPCKKAIPETRELYSNNKDVLTVVGVNMVTNEDLWREASIRDSITWINLSDGKGTFAGVSADYGIHGFPIYILIDPNGIIIDKWMGYRPNIFKDKLSKHIEGLKTQR